MPRRIPSLALLALLAAVPLGATITFSPTTPNADQAVTFSVTAATGTIIAGSAAWDFGDGSRASGPALVQKTYAAAGVYTVRVQYTALITMAAGPMPVTEQVFLTVGERRRLVSLTPSPMVGQTVSLMAENFFSSSILWNFGDGTPAVPGGTTAGHVYAQPGSYTVTARDYGGAGLSLIPLGLTINVDISRRRITYAPPQPAAGFPVVFTASRFYTTELLWSFGDGGQPAPGGLTVSHTFAKPGRYTVQAWDWQGQAGGPTSVVAPVSEPTGLRADFQISLLQLRFEDGLSYKVVPARFAPLLAYVDLKYEGTGLFQAQWLVDGMPFRSISQALPQAQSTTLDSGRLPGLPTLIGGMHEVSLRILSPNTAFSVPVIRYFVTSDPDAPPLAGLDLKMEKADGLDGVDCALTLGELRAAAGRYVVLRGRIQSRLPGPVRLGLLRVHLGTALIDQQIVRDLPPGRPWEFATSVRTPAEGWQPLYLTLYDIGETAAPRLLALQKITVRAGK